MNIRKDQPPFFVRTPWMFAALEELADPSEAEIFAAIKIARFRQNVAGVAVLLNLVAANNETVADGRRRYERRELCKWIRDQIAREQAA